MGKFHRCLTELSAGGKIMAGYYCLMFLFGLKFAFYAVVFLKTCLNDKQCRPSGAI